VYTGAFGAYLLGLSKKKFFMANPNLPRRLTKARQITREQLHTRLYVTEIVSLLRTDWDPERVDEKK